MPGVVSSVPHLIIVNPVRFGIEIYPQQSFWPFVISVFFGISFIQNLFDCRFGTLVYFKFDYIYVAIGLHHGIHPAINGQYLRFYFKPYKFHHHIKNGMEIFLLLFDDGVGYVPKKCIDVPDKLFDVIIGKSADNINQQHICFV